MPGQPEFAAISQTQEFLLPQEIARRIIERRLSYLLWYSVLTEEGGLTGWRLVLPVPEPEPEPTSDEDFD